MKILVVDDSIVFRSAIVSAIGTENGFEVVRSLVNGKLAVDFLAQNSEIDLITLDMEMPVMDGMEAIKEIRKFNKSVVIIVFSSLTHKGAEKTLEALNAGANDFVTKPENSSGKIEDSVTSIKEELLPKIRAFRDRSNRASRTHTPISFKSESPSTVDNSSHSPREDLINPLSFKFKMRPNLIVIGCSTGGPEALGQIFKAIKNQISVPMLIVQHMPPLFTQKLAEMLSKVSPVKVFEAQEGDQLKPGVCYIAPGDYHMTVDENGIIHLDQGAKVCFVRPSVDVLFNSVAENIKGHILSIVLTGMGEDGAVGAKRLQEKGASIFVQDKATSVVWGMPGAVKKQVAEAKLVSINDIGLLIEQSLK
jgi:two-component system chemotaxis response regulator CheB